MSHKFLSLHFPLEDSLVSSHLCPYNSHFLHSLYVLLILPPLIIFTFLSFPQPFLPLFNLYLPAPGPTDWVVEAAAWLHQGIAVFAAQCREEGDGYALSAWRSSETAIHATRTKPLYQSSLGEQSLLSSSFW